MLLAYVTAKLVIFCETAISDCFKIDENDRSHAVYAA